MDLLQEIKMQEADKLC